MAADASTTHFALFGLPCSYDVDRAALDSHYRELQRTMHPDRFAGASEHERRVAMQLAARINEGYQTLKDPLRRGRYLLELKGHRLADEQHTTSDGEFLMEQLELREALAGVRAAADPVAALAGIMDRITADIDALDGGLRERLARDDLEAAAELLMKMQFFRRLQEEATELELVLDDEQA
ncbi:MAG: Fe-S protein assembly co-chaperone HscB [Gammaproteobacteria bacterium]|jgi:molecular chaperone HscB